MTETPHLDPTSADASSRSGRFLPCCYANQSDVTQFIRIKNGTDLVLERVVAPGGRIMFYSVLDGIVEVYDQACDDAATMGSPADIIACSALTTVD